MIAHSRPFSIEQFAAIMARTLQPYFDEAAKELEIPPPDGNWEPIYRACWTVLMSLDGIEEDVIQKALNSEGF